MLLYAVKQKWVHGIELELVHGEETIAFVSVAASKKRSFLREKIVTWKYIRYNNTNHAHAVIIWVTKHHRVCLFVHERKKTQSKSPKRL